MRIVRYAKYTQQLLFLTLGFFILSSGLAQAARATDTGFSGYYVEWGQQPEGRVKVTMVGGWSNFHGALGHLSLAFIDSDERGDALGLDIGAEVHFSPAPVIPYVGYGVFVGYNGSTDHLLATVYPEIGLRLSTKTEWALNIAAKYYVTTGSHDATFLIFSVGLHWPWE